VVGHALLNENLHYSFIAAANAAPTVGRQSVSQSMRLEIMMLMSALMRSSINSLNLSALLESR